jgi:hypothetical protein
MIVVVLSEIHTKKVVLLEETLLICTTDNKSKSKAIFVACLALITICQQQ